MRRLLALPLLVLLVLLPAVPVDAQRTFPAAASTAPLSCDGTNCTLASGQLLLPDGTEDLPALSFTNDTDLGFYRVGANSIGVGAGASNAPMAFNITAGLLLDKDYYVAWSSNTVLQAADTGLKRAGPARTHATDGGTGAGTIGAANTNAGYEEFAPVTEAHTLAAAGTSTTATAVWPANSSSLAASFRITTTITGATSVQVGVAGDATRYGTFSTLTAGQTIAIGRIDNYTAATGILFTAVGGGASFTAGVIRVNLRYVTASAPTS